MDRSLKIAITIVLFLAVLWVCASPVLNLAPTANRAWMAALLLVILPATLAFILAALLRRARVKFFPQPPVWQPVGLVDLNCSRLC